MTDFSDVEAMAGGLLRALAPAQRVAILRKMAAQLAQTNRQRVRANRAPDGSAFAKRAPREPAPQSSHPVSFLYDSGTGPRKVSMTSYAIERSAGGGYQMTGFDTEAGGLRTFLHSRVTKWLTPPTSAAGGGQRKRPRLRQRAMFKKLSSPAHLKARTTDAGFWVGFSGKAAQIANIHHHGLRDRPSLRAKAINYPKRELLGATDADKAQLLDLFFNSLTP